VSEIGMRSDVQSVLAQMKLLQAQAQAELRPPVEETTKPGPASDSFATLLRSATDSVNELQQASGDLSTRFAKGETSDLVSVMVASQKASVAFQGLVHTRNQLVNAYQEIMNMAI
jgi:flagellar hook-basal body complex protein FliE|tara:strand:- start:5985 stop:6329 length:345 start_codon:yes stop_codon:yes gene_type:complete